MTQKDNFENENINKQKFNWSVEKSGNYSLLNLKNKIFSKVEKIFEIKEFDEKIYFNDVLKLVVEYKNIKSWIIDSTYTEQEKKHKKEKNYEELTHKIGHLNDFLLLPDDYKYLVWETKNVISKIKENWKFNLWLNSFLAPWSLTSFRKVIEYWIVKSENIDIDLLNWNLQEWLRIVKHSHNWHEWAFTHFDSGIDDIEKISMKLWDNSSVAHWVVFQAKNLGNNKFEYDLKTGENVFLGINAQIGSGIKIGDNVSVWWGTIIKDDVKIGNNVVIWEWVKIKHNIKIPDNCLIPNWAIIREDYEVIKYEDYIKNELKYDTQKVEKRKRRNFVIKFDDNISREEQISLMENINPDYPFMATFNEKLVSPENKLFAVINTMLSIINKHFPNVWVIKEEEFNSILSFEEAKAKMPNIEDELIKNELKRPIKLSLKAFPKNKEKFLSELIPEMIEALKTEKDITEKIKSYLDFSEIPKNKQEVFLGTNTFTWKCSVDEKSLVYDTYIRSDELHEWDKVEIKNSVVVKWILHWGWDKILEDSSLTCVVVHGKMIVFRTNVGHYKHHSVYHNCELDEVEQTTWWIVANWVNIKKSKIWFGVNFMPFKDILKKWIKWNIENSDIWDYVIIWNSSVKDCTIWDESYIWNWLAFEWKYIEWKVYGKDKHKSQTHILDDKEELL